MAQRRFPPGPSSLRAMRGLQSLGGGTDLRGIPIFLADVAAEYGPIAHWTILGRHFYFLDDPGLIEEAFVLRGRDYKKGRGIERLKPLLGNGLLSSEEPLHRRQRRMIQPAFHRERIAAYGAQMVAAARRQIAAWQPGSTLEIHAQMMRLTLTIAAQTLFSADVTGDADTVRSSLDTVMREFPGSVSLTSGLTDLLPLPSRRRFERARARLDAIIYGLIADRRAAPSGRPDDVLSMLLTARDGGAAMDDRQIRDEMMTLFLAGHETTANALAWTWYLLSRHPAAARALQDEVRTVLAGRPPSAADIPQLRFTRDVFAEAMRLYPPAWLVGRRALADTRLGAYAVARGSVVLACQLVTHRSSRWWLEPDTFRPERWRADPPVPRFAYFPFGGGTRLCIGESFAWTEGVLLIAAIAQQFRFEAVDTAPVEPEPLVTLRPRSPIRLRVAPADRGEVAGTYPSLV